MSPTQILAELARRGAQVQAKGDRIRVKPTGVLTPELAAAIKARRAEVLVELGRRARELTRGVPEPELEISRFATCDLDMPMRCAACGQVRTVMLAMEPGPDKTPWALCSRCW